MRFDGAVVKEQGVTFAIVVVKPFVLDVSTQREETRDVFRVYFPGLPIILMAQKSGDIPIYHGRRDIVNFLANIHPARISWKTYNIN